MSYWKLFYHVVWATKDRLPLIRPEMEPALFDVMAAKGIKLGGTVFAVGGVENHVHLAVAIPPSIAVTEFVGQLKGSSSHFVNKVLGAEFKWQNEFGVLSFGLRNLEQVTRYIENQRQHHAENTCIRGLERIES